MNAEGAPGFPANQEEAVFWFSRAAEKNHPKALNNLGIMYFTGKGVVKDESKAVVYFLRAAQLGDANAQHNLGLIHETGAGGVPQNTDAAFQWYKKAADNGSELSKQILRSDAKPVETNRPDGELILITGGATSSSYDAGAASTDTAMQQTTTPKTKSPSRNPSSGPSSSTSPVQSYANTSQTTDGKRR